MFSPGVHIAKISDWGVSYTKRGDPQPFILFDVGGSTMKWFGSLNTEKMTELTVKVLRECGMDEPDFTKLSQGLPGGALTVGLERKVTVVDETYNGKTNRKIKWVNPPSAEKFDKVMQQDQAKLDEMNQRLAKYFPKKDLGF
jgi:hypothetical protein